MWTTGLTAFITLHINPMNTFIVRLLNDNNDLVITPEDDV